MQSIDPESGTVDQPPIVSESQLFLEAQSNEELLAKLRVMDVLVPPRGQGRKPIHCETRTMARLLSTLSSAKMWAAPIRIMKRERPDFQVELRERVVGVEFTEATQQDFVETLMLPDARSNVCAGDRSRFQVGGYVEVSDRRQIAMQQSLTGPGWIGDAMEHEWVAGFQQTIAAKTAKLAGYTRYDENWLLVYDNLMLVGVNVEKAIGMLRTAMTDYWQSDHFDAVAIDSEDEIWLVTSKGVQRLDVADLWTGEAGE